MLSIHRILKTWQKKINIYIALNKYGCELFVRGGIPAENIMISPNFVDPDPEPEPNNQPGDYALFVGRLSKEKGLDTLLDAWKRLTGIPLQIIGSGPLMRGLTERIRRENIDNVELLGRKSHEETITMLKKARVLIFPSEWLETFGLGIIEAFACGVPVIAAKQKTIEEIIQHGMNGLLFKPGDAHDLAQSINEHWDKTDLLQEMGRKARLSFLSKYSRQQKYNSLMETYERAIQDNNK
jgi:glycosyltransferase involved in cell wall biosynthesis